MVHHAHQLAKFDLRVRLLPGASLFGATPEVDAMVLEQDNRRHTLLLLAQRRPYAFEFVDGATLRMRGLAKIEPGPIDQCVHRHAVTRCAEADAGHVGAGAQIVGRLDVLFLYFTADALQSTQHAHRPVATNDSGGALVGTDVVGVYPLTAINLVFPAVFAAAADGLRWVLVVERSVGHGHPALATRPR